MDQMTTDAFNLKGEDGQTLSIGYCYEAFGIIVNKALLEKAGHSIDEITNFESLKAVADDIHARASELGFDAFRRSRRLFQLALLRPSGQHAAVLRVP